MHQFIPLLLLPLVPFALGQYGDSGGPSSSTTATSAPASTTSSSSGSVHTVTVGANGLLGFSPNTTTAAAGSTVEFHFFPPTHSVVQGSFSSPCAPLNATSFYSGGMVTSSGENAMVFTVTINDTSPIWFYCGFPTHCQTGMVGVINPPSDTSQTLSLFKAAAAKTTNSTTPPHAQGGVVGAANAATSSSSSASTSATSKPNDGPKAQANWVGAVVGPLALGLGFAGLIV